MGVWRVHDDEAPFRWDVKDEIWLSTKLGRIIIGRSRAVIEITCLAQTVSFKGIFKDPENINDGERH
jgi:hypothetical protein